LPGTGVNGFAGLGVRHQRDTEKNVGAGDIFFLLGVFFA